jgi:hypothetical protein
MEQSPAFLQELVSLTGESFVIGAEIHLALGEYLFDELT